MLNSLLLLTAALVLAAVFFPVGLVVTLIVAIKQGSASKILDYLDKSALVVAISLDCLGNVIAKDLLNATLIQKGGYPFGKYYQTISLVLGKNKQRGTLTSAGVKLAGWLNALDENHVEKAAEMIYES